MDTIRVRHPREDDILGDRFTIVGIGTAFEGTVGWRLRVGGNTVEEGSMQGGSNGVFGEFSTVVTVNSVASPTAARLQVFGDNPALPEGESPGIDTQTIPVVLVPGARGFEVYEVVAGDTLSELVRDHGAVSVDAIVVANSDLISDPDHIEIGWTLRLPVR